MSSNPRIDRPTTPSPQEQRGTRDRALRVLLVEDSDLLVQRITELVDDLADIEIVGTAAAESEALARLEAGDIDAVILDLQLHSGSGFGILRALHRREAPPTVIVFTNFAIGAYRDTALALGAQHFLDKSRDYHRLPAVLRELSDSMH
jgi:Response regulator containing a CheY-like receiver domain and an HTH DNA-binding domain